MHDSIRKLIKDLIDQGVDKRPGFLAYKIRKGELEIGGNTISIDDDISGLSKDLDIKVVDRSNKRDK